VVLLAAALSLVGTAGTADPYQIFAQARQVWAQQRYPDYLTYVVAVAVTERGVEKSKHYHLAYDAQTGKIAVNPVSDEEQAAPPDPNGVTIHLQPKRNFHTLLDKRVGNPGEAVDYLGVPMIAPTYSFGMALASDEGEQTGNDALVAQIRQEFNDPVPAEKTQQAVTDPHVRTIAAVTTFVRRYTITLAGIDTLAGGECYHLLLQPNYDPQKLRLREVWVDTHTYETRQLISAGNFSSSKVPWLITFDDAGGAQYIASETALAPVGVGDHQYEHASVSFESIEQTARPTRPLSFFVTKENLMSEPETEVHR
jgi:hypothetical protein